MNWTETVVAIVGSCESTNAYRDEGYLSNCHGQHVDSMTSKYLISATFCIAGKAAVMVQLY